MFRRFCPIYLFFGDFVFFWRTVISIIGVVNSLIVWGWLLFGKSSYLLPSFSSSLTTSVVSESELPSLHDFHTFFSRLRIYARIVKFSKSRLIIWKWIRIIEHLLPPFSMSIFVAQVIFIVYCLCLILTRLTEIAKLVSLNFAQKFSIYHLTLWSWKLCN